MIKSVTSVTVFTDAVGTRLSFTYSEIDENEGTVISDNNRMNRVITNQEMKNNVATLFQYAQSFVDNN